jgi:hypothetical protein
MAAVCLGGDGGLLLGGGGLCDTPEQEEDKEEEREEEKEEVESELGEEKVSEDGDGDGSAGGAGPGSKHRPLTNAREGQQEKGEGGGGTSAAAAAAAAVVSPHRVTGTDGRYFYLVSHQRLRCTPDDTHGKSLQQAMAVAALQMPAAGACLEDFRWSETKKATDLAIRGDGKQCILPDQRNGDYHNCLGDCELSEGRWEWALKLDGRCRNMKVGVADVGLPASNYNSNMYESSCPKVAVYYVNGPSVFDTLTGGQNAHSTNMGSSCFQVTCSQAQSSN